MFYNRDFYLREVEIRMTCAQHILTLLNYGTSHTMPPTYMGAWSETHERWRREGIPEGMDEHAFFGVPSAWLPFGPDVGLFPKFEVEELEDCGDSTIYRDESGVVCKAMKSSSSIPHYIDYTLKTPEDWEKHYKWRLMPNDARLGVPGSLQADFERKRATGAAVTLFTGSLMGWPRDWMGVENLAYFINDYPDTFADMVDTISDLVCWAADQVLPWAKVDYGFGWEDICGRCGPFVSPDAFRKFVAPGYAKIRAKLEQYGIHLYGIDSDGDVSALVGPWLDAGVNVFFPIEPGTWKADGMALRKKFGKEMRIIGHFDKMTLEQGRPAILAEFERLRPLMADGGFVLMPDHLITPGVALKDFQWYLEQLRALKY